jgi:hypothetical protein
VNLRDYGHRKGFMADHKGRHARLSYNWPVASSSPDPRPVVITPVLSALKAPPQDSGEARTVCERCGAEMYRMHAVWRCPACRFKTDCCGW